MQKTTNRWHGLAALLLVVSLATSAAAAPVPDYTVPDIRASWHALLPVFARGDYNAAIDSRMNWHPSIELAGVAVDKQGSFYAACNTFVGTPGARKGQLVLVKHDAGGQRVWQQTIGDDKTPARSIQVAVDSRDNVYLAGWMSARGRDQISYGGFAMSYTSAGKLRWSHIIDLKDVRNNSEYTSLAVDSTSVYLVGHASEATRVESQVLLTRLSLDGKKIWSQKYEIKPKQKHSPNIGVTVTPGGSVCVIVNTASAIVTRDNDPTHRTIGFVMGVDARGRKLWTTEVGMDLDPKVPREAATSTLRSITHDQQGNLYVTGSGSGTLARRLPPRFPQHTVVPVTFLAKLSENGKILWSHPVNEMHEDLKDKFAPHRVRVASSGDVFVCGPLKERPAILKLDSNGKLLSLSIYAAWPFYNAGDFDFTPQGGHAIVHGLYYPVWGGQTLFGAPKIDPTVAPPQYFFAQINLDGPEPVRP